MVKLGKFKKQLHTLYTDKMQVFRHEEVENGAFTETKLSDTPVMENIPCRISFNNDDMPETRQVDVNSVNLSIKVFCDSQHAIFKGDLLEINRLDDDGTVLEMYQGRANMPYIYPTHQEILITQLGDA